MFTWGLCNPVQNLCFILSLFMMIATNKYNCLSLVIYLLFFVLSIILLCNAFDYSFGIFNAFSRLTEYILACRVSGKLCARVNYVCVYFYSILLGWCIRRWHNFDNIDISWLVVSSVSKLCFWYNYRKVLFQFFFSAMKYLTVTHSISGPSWSWSYGSWIYNYSCNQCLSPLMLCFQMLLDTTLLYSLSVTYGRSVVFSGYSVSFTNKTDGHHIV